MPNRLSSPPHSRLICFLPELITSPTFPHRHKTRCAPSPIYTPFLYFRYPITDLETLPVNDAMGKIHIGPRPLFWAHICPQTAGRRPADNSYAFDFLRALFGRFCASEGPPSTASATPLRFESSSSPPPALHRRCGYRSWSSTGCCAPGPFVPA